MNSSIYRPSFEELREDYNWREAIRYAAWKLGDVQNVLAARYGDNDGPSWELIVLLKDGRFSILSASCDYTGWDCNAGGSSSESDNWADFIRYSLDDVQRVLFGITLREEEDPAYDPLRSFADFLTSVPGSTSCPDCGCVVDPSEEDTQP